MKQTIDFKECLKDSPKFRSSLEDAENDIESLEYKLEKLVKLCTTMIDTGKSFSNASSGFVTGIRDIARYFNDDELVSASLNRFAHVMSETIKYFHILMDQANRSICKNITYFIKNDIKKVKETKKHFESISDKMDNAFIRNSQALKSKQQECEEANNELTAMKACFAHTSLDYVFQINILHSKKRFDVLDTMLAFMHAQSTFFHQGHDLFSDLEKYMKDVAAQVEYLSAKSAAERKEMEERHTLVQQQDVYEQGNQESEQTDDMEGYLFKRTSNAFKSWVRRWFRIQNNQLIYVKRTKDSQYSIMEKDLRLCSVKPAYEIDRRYCLEVLSPTGSHMLQADSDVSCQRWIVSIQAGVTKAFRESSNQNQDDSPKKTIDVSDNNATTDAKTSAEASPSPQDKKTKSQLRVQQLLSVPGNDKCCDCGSTEPRWASINLGITLCIECSGIHRSFGVHLSKVRSITLDAWDPELLKVMAELGNNVINRIFEANVEESIAVRATPECNRSVRENWIKSKYVHKSFVPNLPGTKNLAEGNHLRGWSVRRKKKKSPVRTLNKEDSQSDPDEKMDVTSGLLEAVLSVSSNNGEDLPSDSPNDVIVFGTELPLSDINKSLDLESSDESSQEVDDGDDSRSTTSWEDMSKLDPNMLLFKAAEARNLPVMLEALANGANPNWVSIEDQDKTPLMKAVETGSLTACEFLLLNGAKLDRKDRNGRSPLHHATIHGNTGQVCQFLKRGADLSLKDVSGLDPLAIAVSAANADIVTLLRLARLNEEMKESDVYGQPGDETFNDVFKDFSNMASNNPEKLKRK